jgi:hypothetical protein
MNYTNAMLREMQDLRSEVRLLIEGEQHPKAMGALLAVYQLVDRRIKAGIDLETCRDAKVAFFDPMGDVEANAGI